MNMSVLPVFAFTAGAAIAVQAAINAQLGVALKNTLLGTSVAFLCSFFLCALAVMFFTKQFPSMALVISVPSYLWFGGVLSAIGVGLFYFLIPKMGVGSLMSYALTGQIMMAMLVGHFGWFELPVKEMTTMKFIGTAVLIAGVLLVNWES
jgi:transporter family-2 protein